MDGGTGPVGEMLSPGEAEWPPELRLPPPPPLPDPVPPPRRNEPSPPLPPPSPPPGSGPRLTAWLQAPAAPSTKKEPTHSEGFDDSQFLGSIMDAAAPLPQQQQQPAVAAAVEPSVVVKRKRGRPPKNRDGVVASPAPPKPVKKSDEEVVCFICFDGGSLVVCDRRGCPKVYHPACIKRDESFFQSRVKWNCGWHICSSCEKAVHYMCYTCTYSLCKGCIKQGKFFGVRGNKGFCDICYGTILLIESRYEDDGQVRVDFDDKNSWEYLFKLYWLDIKGKHLLTLDELISAKSSWTVRNTSARREKEESSDELYDANNDHDSDNSSRKRKGNNFRKRGRKRQNHGGITARNCEISIKGAASIPKVVPIEGMDLSGDTKWASSELLEFISHMRNGDKSHISQFDVQVLLLEYIKQNNLRDPCSKSQIICDARLSNLFRKPRVGHFEMLKLLDSHFHVKATPTVNGDSQRALDPDSAQVDTGGYNEMATKLCCDKRRKTHKKIESDPPANLEDYAAIDMHNINLIYLRRSLMEDLIDDGSAFSEKITGAFVRIRISGAGQKQDMYRLVKVLGTHKVAERYSVGKKTTDCALEISNLDKKEVISMDTISNQDFTEEECKRLRQSMKYGLITRLKVVDIHEKAKTFQSLRINDWLENEKQRLSHLRDRASETGHRKELRECVEKLQLLNTPEERARKINEVPEVHVDPHMAPNYESAEEWNDKKTVDWTINRNGPDLLFPGRKGTESNSVQYGTQKSLDAIHSMSLSPPTEGVTHRSGAGSNINLQSVNEWNIPRSRIDLNNTAGEAPSVSSSGVVSSDMEPEKVWHYKDPSGNAQGPFTLSQLSKWTSFFPRDMRIWLTFESEQNSLLLTEVLSKQQKDFMQPTGKASSETCTGEDRSNSNVAESTTSPVGYNIAYSSGLSSQFAHCPPRKEGLNRLGGALPSTTSWEPPKDSQTLCHQTKHQANNPCTIPSSAGSYGSLESYGKGAPRENIGEPDNRQDTAGMWSPTPPHRSHSNQITVEPHPGVSAVQKQLEKYSKSDSLAGFAKIPQQSERDLAISLGTSSPSEFTTTLHKSHHSCQSNIVPRPEGCTTQKQLQNVPKSNLLPESHVQANFNLQMDFGLQKTHSAIPQQSERDLATPLGSSSPSEVKTVQKQEDICWSATTNPAAHDEIQFSIASAKPESCSVTNPVKDRDSDSASCLLSQSRAPACSPQSVPSTCTSNSSKTEEIMNPHKICAPDAANAPVNQRPEPKSDPVLCTDPEDQYPSPTPKLEGKEPSVNQSELTSVAHEDSSAKAYDPPGGKIVSLQLLKKTSCLEERDLIGGCSITQTEQLKDEPTSVRGETMVANPVSVAEAIAVSDVLESLTEQNCGTYNMHGATSLENFTRASAEEEQPQCSSPIALSPWGEASYYQSEAVDSAMWGVQDDPSNDMWSLSSPTPALQPSSGLGADGKDTSCIIEEVIVAQGNSAIIEMSPKAEDEKMEKWNSSASTGWGAPEQVKPKPSSGSSSPLKTIKSSGLQLLGSSLAGGTKAFGAQPSSSLLDGSRRPSASQPSGSFLEGNTKASGWQPSGSSLDRSTKASGWQPSGSSLDGSTKASGWQPSGSSVDGSTKASGWSSAIEESPKASGWQPSGSSLDGSTKPSAWGSALDGSPKASGRGSYLEGSTQASGWLRSSSSPEGRKAPGWHSSGRESSKVNSTSSASQNRNSSSSHQTMTSTAKNSLEAPRRQGNTNTSTAGWGEALGNKSWHSSSGNASRGSQSSQHHDRYSRGNESRRGTSQSNESRRGTPQGNESRRGGSDHSRRSDYRQDHGSGGSSRSSSRGQPPRGICKYYESGHCRRGSSCHYLHR